jgi:hypothetical protein
MIDYIKETEEIIAQLKLQKKDDEAIRLSDALNNGSTGTEIAMSLRWVMNEVLNKSIGVSLESQKRMRNIVTQLASFLND